MKIKVHSQGETTIDLDAEYQEPAIREAIEDGCNDVASEIIDYTDNERSDICHAEYAVVTEDDGSEKWRGWLDPGRKGHPAPDAALRGRLEALLATWDSQAGGLAGVAAADPVFAAAMHTRRDCAKALRDVLGGAPASRARKEA